MLTQKVTALYGYKDLDERVLYNFVSPIKIVSPDQFKHLLATKKPFMILIDDTYLTDVKLLAECVVKEFKHYLKKHKTLNVLNFNADCAH